MQPLTEKQPVEYPLQDPSHGTAAGDLPVKKGSSALAGFFRAVGAIVWKDLQAELRSRELLSSMLVFALLVILIFNFALELDAKTRAAVTSGVLWVTFAFAGTFGLNRSMAMEKDRGCLDGLLLAPVDRSAIYFGKTIGNLLFMLIVEAIVLPVYSILYNTNLFNPGLIVVILLGLDWLCGRWHVIIEHGSSNSHSRRAPSDLIISRLILPVFIASVKASTGFLQGLEMTEISPWLNLLIVYDLIFTRGFIYGLRLHCRRIMLSLLTGFRRRAGCL